MDGYDRMLLEVIQNFLQGEREKKRNLLERRKLYRAGSLIIRQKRNKLYYSELIRGKEKGLTKDGPRLQKVIIKNKLDNQIANTEINISILDMATKAFKRAKYDRVHSHLKKLEPQGSNYTAEDIAWMKGGYAANPYYTDNLKYVTTMGVVVRSKSELSIANWLEKKGIPYRYEQKMYFNGKVYYPDFIIKKPNGELLIWEHFGLTDDKEYVEKAIEKIGDYHKAGYRQNKNLIVTCEEDIKTPEDIDRIIKRYIFF